jgi:hypothetical protein
MHVYIVDIDKYVDKYYVNSSLANLLDRVTSSHYALVFGDIHVLQGEQ